MSCVYTDIVDYLRPVRLPSSSLGVYLFTLATWPLAVIITEKSTRTLWKTLPHHGFLINPIAVATERVVRFQFHLITGLSTTFDCKIVRGTTLHPSLDGLLWRSRISLKDSLTLRFHATKRADAILLASPCTHTTLKREFEFYLKDITFDAPQKIPGLFSASSTTMLVKYFQVHKNSWNLTKNYSLYFKLHNKI